jgi:hypothetical protein
VGGACGGGAWAGGGGGSVAGTPGGEAAAPNGPPQDWQNLTPAGLGLPQFGQNWVAIGSR